jgi:acyl transferase domain-containing protein/NADP-dependent 3-hydroxy acid dehydrogenase YdfG
MTRPTDDPGALSPLRRAFLALEEMQAKVARLEGARTEPLAVIGLGCRFPGGAVDPAAFWRLLRDGVDAVTEVPRDRWDVDAYYDRDVSTPGRTATRWGAFIEHVDRFDAAFFGISPREAIAMDPQHRLLLEVTWEALESAGQAPDRLGGSRTGVYVGIASGDYAQRLLAAADSGRLDAYYASGNAHSMAAGRLSYLLGLQGPSLTVDTACSSSLVAVHLACQSLRSGECRMAVAGGVHLTLSPENTIAFSKARMLAADGRCKTFDAAADGFSEGEGCGIVVLKRLSDALADGDRVLAVVRGSAVNQDGPSAGLTAPSGPAQEAVIREALANGGVAPEDVAYVEAHGTGTSLGDPIEIRAIASVLAAHRSPERRLLLGSVKTNVGHLEAAAGVAGLIKVVLALQHGEIPPHLHFRTPNPHVAWSELAVDVVGTARPWPVAPRVAGLSSFGFSGTNAHVILEAATAAAPVTPSLPARPAHVLTLSAKSPGALDELAGRYASHLDHHDLDLADVCFSAGTGRAQLEHRLAIVASTAEEARVRLRSLKTGEASPRVARGHVPPSARRPRVAFLFPGQGAQYAGMGRGLYAGSAVFRAAVDRVAAALGEEGAARLSSVLRGEAVRVDETATAQVALFAVQWGLAEVWRAWGVRPTVVTGHSVGEYAAACVAGVMEVEAAARVVAERGRLMGALPAGGAMVAVGARPAVVAAVVTAVRASGAGEVGIAAVNGPESVVVSGAAAAVEAVVARLAERGIRSQELRVSHAFHSGLMAPMQGAFAAAVAQERWGPPALTWVSTVTGQVQGAADGGYWVRQVREPVQFATAMATVGALGVEACVEVGPGTTLLGLGRGCVEDAAARLWVPSMRAGRGDWEFLLEGLGQLWAAGVEVDWAAFDRGQPRRRVALPTYPWQGERYWLPSASAPPVMTRGAASGRGATVVAHPLIARRLHSPLPGAQFEAELSARSPGFLDQHRIDGMVVVPATAHLEMIGTAALACVGPAHRIDDLTLQQTLVIPDGETRTVQVVLTPAAGGSMTAQVWSLAGDGAAGWTLHVEGRVRPDDEAIPSGVALDEARARCTETLSGTDFYARLAGRGLELGSSFRGVRQVERTDGEALARIELPAEVTDEPRYRMHPLLLDACIQAIAAAVPEPVAPDHVFVPMALDRFRVLGRAGRRLWSRVRITSPPVADTLTADLQVLDEDSRLVGELLGLRLKRAAGGASGRPTTPIAGWLHEIAWQPAPLPPASEGAGDTVARLATEVARWASRPELVRYDEAMRALDRLSVAYIVGALRSLCGDLRPGRPLPREGLAATLGVMPRYRHLLDRWLDILVEDGLLRATDEGWVTERGGSDPGVEPLRDSLRDHEAVAGAETAFLLRCGPRLADVVRGTCDPLALLFPDGSREVAERLYHESPPALISGGLVRAAVEAALARLPAGRPVRILEVGGGTGGTTAALLPALPAEGSEYVFTDVSAAFTARARERFAAYPFLLTRTLDIEADPSPEEIAAPPFDIVVAANVLHATADLRRTLEHCRRRLAPGGALILVEVTVPQRWLDLTFGLTEGWWRFSDHALRPHYPLLGQSQWVSLLESAGFARVTAAPEPGTVRGTLGHQSVIAAVRRETAADGSGADGRPWVVLADRGGVGDRLAERLRARGAPCVVVHAVGGGVGLAAESTPVDPSDATAVRRALEAAAGGVEPRGVVSLWALDASEEMESAAPLAGAVGALHVVQGLVGGATVNPRLWLVSRGAQRLPMDATPPALAQAPVWGIARTALREHPELRCVSVDLDPSPTADPAGELLADLLAPRDNEEQIAWRDGQRFAARLVRSPDQRFASAETVERLQRAEPASLAGLTLRPVPRRAPGPGEVEIAVRAAALNFKDVLNALDMYPGEAGPLGSECAGTIVAVGARVAGLRVGDHVVAIAAGGLATSVIARAVLVVPKPSRLTFEQAASLPVAFITGAHALFTVGGLRRGERVLVHAAAGGVGLAAVRLAQRCGARVLATAGSAEKRDFLRAQGVADVFDSRSVEFRDEVLRATDGHGVDVVLNSLSGDAIGASVAVLARDGRFLEIGKRGIWSDGEMRRARPDVRYTVIDWSDLAVSAPEAVRQHVIEILAAVEAGELPAPPVTVFALSDAASAFRHMAQARHRGKVVLVPAEPRPAPAPAIRDDATYLVTGGLGGLGLEVARWLVARGARSVALVGRRAPSAGAAATIAALEQAGARVTVLQTDVSDRAQVDRLLVELRAGRPPLRGMIHAAGVLDDGLLAQQDAGKLARVMAAKVAGTCHLAAATQRLPLDFFVLFSSIASVLGSPGQANHAAANAYLDAFAHHRRARGLPALSINWGAWAEVGAVVEHDADRRLASRGIERMRPDDGLAALEAAMGGGAVQVMVAPVDWTVFLSRLPGEQPPSLLRDVARRARAAAPATAPARGERNLRADLEAAAPAKRHALLRNHIAERTRRVLGLDAGQLVDPLRPLKELGIDSLMAVELRNLLKSDLSLDGGLPATLVFDYPTVDGIAHYLAREVLGLEPTAATAATVPMAATALSRVEELSDEEVDRLLGERLGSNGS